MIIVIGKIILLLAAILFVCLWFTNAVENIGVRLKLGEQVVGSLLAAIGTALPETLLPIIAIFLAGSAHGDPKTDIAIGSIVGAPFLLSTLAMALLGLAILVSYKKRQDLNLRAAHGHISKDLTYFIIALSIAMLATLFPDAISKIVFTVILLGIYVTYFVTTLREGSNHNHSEEDAEGVDALYISSVAVAGFRLPSNLFWMIAQVLLSLLGIIYFAHRFIISIEEASVMMNVSPLVLSLIIAPIATELPEKVNSWFWASSGKDGLAMGNITGAMVFQSAIPCAVGVSMTPWDLDSHTMFCFVLALLSAFILLLSLKVFKRVHAATLTFLGFLYLLYLVAIILF